jgi:hypothetical protein
MESLEERIVSSSGTRSRPNKEAESSSAFLLPLLLILSKILSNAI